MNNHLKSIAVYVLVASVSVLTLIAVLSIWNVFSQDVLWKSISTIGIVAFGAVIVIIAGQALEHKNNPPTPPNPMQ